jgi:hypothetical protein
MAAEVRPASASEARRAGARRHGVLAPDPNSVAGTVFKFEFLQKFE